MWKYRYGVPDRSGVLKVLESKVCYSLLPSLCILLRIGVYQQVLSSDCNVE